jgi:hypothetical protein
MEFATLKLVCFIDYCQLHLKALLLSSPKYSACDGALFSFCTSFLTF